MAMPAQIFGGLVMLAVVSGAMAVAWRHGLEDFLGRLPSPG
jgi:flagellar biosynthesis protein FliR